MDDDFTNLGGDFTEEETPPPPRNNRTLLIAAGVLGAIFILALIGIGVYSLVIGPRLRAQEEAQIAQVHAQQTVTALAMTREAAESRMTALPKAPTLTAIPTATRTPVAALATSTSIVAPASLQQTATAAPTATQRALLPTATALPSTGFADEVGLPGLLGITIGLIAVIWVARRLRS